MILTQILFIVGLCAFATAAGAPDESINGDWKVSRYVKRDVELQLDRLKSWKINMHYNSGSNVITYTLTIGAGKIDGSVVISEPVSSSCTITQESSDAGENAQLKKFKEEGCGIITKAYSSSETLFVIYFDSQGQGKSWVEFTKVQ